MIYVTKTDYDGATMIECETDEIAEKTISEILVMQAKEENGTSLNKVIEGEELNYDVIEVVKQVKLQR